MYVERDNRSWAERRFRQMGAEGSFGAVWLKDQYIAGWIGYDGMIHVKEL